MQVGIIHWEPEQNEKAKERRICSLWAGTSIFSCPGTLGLLVLGPLELDWDSTTGFPGPPSLHVVGNRTSQSLWSCEPHPIIILSLYVSYWFSFSGDCWLIQMRVNLGASSPKEFDSFHTLGHHFKLFMVVDCSSRSVWFDLSGNPFFLIWKKFLFHLADPFKEWNCLNF